jgi:hypothetical protein
VETAVAVSFRAMRLEKLLLRIQLERIRSFLFAGDVGRRSGCHERSPRGNGHQPADFFLSSAARLRRASFQRLAQAAGASFPLENERLERAAPVGNRFDRVQVFGEDDPFLERLDHLFVIEPVGR